MARPKRLKEPARLDLLIEKTSKRKAGKMAFRRKISIGRLFENLVEAEEARSVNGNGEIKIPSQTPEVAVPV